MSEEQDSYIKTFLHKALAGIDDLEKMLQEVRTRALLTSAEQEAMKRDTQQIREALEVIRVWMSDAAPKIARLHQESEEGRQRRIDLAWKLAASALLAVAAALVGAWFSNNGFHPK